MKGLLCCCFIGLFSFSHRAAIITWDGGAGDGLWITPTNWVGDILPGSADDVVLDNSALGGGYAVLLPNTAVVIRSLRITPVSSASITLVLPFSNIITTGAFVTTGTGYTITLDANSIFQNNANVSSGTNLIISDSFRINNGGTYIHRTGSGHSSWVSRLARIAGTENGVFLFNVPAAGFFVSLSDRCYGTLVFSAMAHGAPVAYSGSGASPLTIRGQLIINNNATLGLSMSADVNVYGDCYLMGASSVFNVQNSTNNNVVRLFKNLFSLGILTETGMGTPQLLLNGNTVQYISITGVFSNSIELNINNSSGVVLLSPVVLPYHLRFTNGKIISTATNLLTLVDNAVHTGASAASFIEGPVKKIGNDDFLFPVGTGSIYAPIGIINVSGESVTDEFTAEYKRANPQSVHGPIVQSGQNHVSYVEYWSLNSTGAAIKKVSLTVNVTSFCKVVNNTYVSRYDGAQWTSEGATVSGFVAIPPFETGVVTSTNNIASFSDFTLITDLPFDINPLPIDLVSFEAIWLNNRRAKLKWELATNCDPSTRFEVQRSNGLHSFETIASLAGSETTRFYTHYDDELQPAVNHYRLKITQAGHTKYSLTKFVMNGSQASLHISLIPGYNTNSPMLVINSPFRQQVTIVLMDMQGRLLQKKDLAVSEGVTSIHLSAGKLKAGIYLVFGISASGKTNTVKLVMQ